MGSTDHQLTKGNSKKGEELGEEMCAIRLNKKFEKSNKGEAGVIATSILDARSNKFY